MAKAGRLAPHRHWGEIHLVLVDDAGIRAVHDAWMNLPTPTDVLSLCYDPVPGESGASSGEIVINVQRAASLGTRVWRPKKGHRTATGIDRELALYLAHGCDHLAGASDATPTKRQRMRRRELRWLLQADAAGLLRGLVRVIKP